MEVANGLTGKNAIKSLILVSKRFRQFPIGINLLLKNCNNVLCCFNGISTSNKSKWGLLFIRYFN